MKKCGVNYVHFGLLNSVRRILCENQVIISNQKINLIVNVDGGLLYKSIIDQLCAVKRLILFWKEVHIDYSQYRHHKNFKQVEKDCVHPALCGSHVNSIR